MHTTDIGEMHVEVGVVVNVKVDPVNVNIPDGSHRVEVDVVNVNIPDGSRGIQGNALASLSDSSTLNVDILNGAQHESKFARMHLGHNIPVDGVIPNVSGCLLASSTLNGVDVVNDNIPDSSHGIS